MPNFEYKAKSGPQKIINGVILADNERDAIEKLLKLGQTPLEVKLQLISNPILFGNSKKSQKEFIKVPLSTVAIFTRQMSDMIDAGIPLIRCLEILMNQKQSPSMLKVIEIMYSFVKEGGSLSTALAQHPKTFSLLYVNMVKAAELGGYLPQALNRLADFIEQDLQMRNQIKGSLLYPAIVFVIGILTMFVMFSFVLPRLTVMFDDLNSALPIPTQIVIALSGFFSQFWWLIIILTLLIAYFLKQWLDTPQGRLYFDTFVFKIPIFKRFIQDVEMARFAKTMGTLLEGGVTISSALESVTAIIDNVVLKEEIQKIAQKVKEGSSLTTTLKKSYLFSETAVNLISVGEESGKMEKGLYKLAQMCERSASQTASNFVTILGPAVLVVVVGIVGFIIVSILLPMFKMNMIVN